MAAGLDTAQLASFTGSSPQVIDSLLTAPTVELVVDFIRAVAAIAQEHERLKADNLRLTVEHENAVRNAETKVRTFKSSTEKALQEVDGLRTKLDREEATRIELEGRLQNLQASASTSSTEVEHLQTRVKQLEKANRDSLSLLETKVTACDKLAQDATTQQQKSQQFRRDISSIQEKLTSAENEVSNAKFRESALQQELDLLKRSNQWLDSEIKTKTAEHTKFRKDKNARVAELQRQNEDSISTAEALQRKENTLQKRLTEVAAKAEEAFVKIQRLQDEAARQQDAFRAELEGARRLAQLQEQSAASAKRRVQELDNAMDSLKQDSGDEISRLQSELEAEAESKASLETRIEELEHDLDAAQTGLSQHQQQVAMGPPATPMRRSRNGTATPNRASSPILFSPSSTNGKPRSMTEMYSELTTVKNKLRAEESRSTGLAKALEEMVQDLEQKGPELEELEGERIHLQHEVERLSSALLKAGDEKEVARKDCRKAESQLEGLNWQAEILRQQSRDLGAQIKVLLAEVQVRSDGSELTLEERQKLRSMAEQGGDSSYEGMTDTARYISQHLVTFRNVFELQETNAKLLHLTRTLGEQMEGEEARAKQNEQDKQRQELEDLKAQCTRYTDELQSMRTQSASYVQERDMFRRMLAHRGQLPTDGEARSLFANSINGAPSPAPSRSADAEGDATNTARQLSEHIKLVREMQTHFDAYRKESAVDHQTLKDQISSLARDKGDLQSEIARAASQLTLASERYEMLQSNYNFLKTETEEARKRSQALAESAAKQDVKTQQVAEELVEIKGVADSMRNENANLKAERDLWERIRSRLSEENQSLLAERARLNKSVADMQTMANERDFADKEARRRLEQQIELQETELRSSIKKLDEAAEEKKRDDMRKQYDLDQSRVRIDDLMQSLTNSKEEASAAKTTRDQLQIRVDELKIELRNAEERAQALRPRPTHGSSGSSASMPVEGDETAMTREQELAVEVADLRKELELAKGELESAKIQVSDYRAISQRSEEELMSLNETQDQYRQEIDGIIAEKDARTKDLEQRIEDISSELGISNTQLSELRSKADDATSRLEQQQATFNEEFTRIKGESERHLETARFHQADLRAQAEIAQQAQQSYEVELVKHAEAAQALQKVRTEYNEVKMEVSQAKADAEAARGMLAQNEESWSSTKDQYEQELEDHRRRLEDISKQNKILHQQLENTSTQIAQLQQDRAIKSPTTAGNDSDDASVQNFQEVITYLRREKEIVTVQFELSRQEANRLRQQYEYTQAQLDETRVKLEEHRHKTANEGQSSISHAKLMETINELNVYRESSVTLRNEARNAQAQLDEKNRLLERLNSQLEPLKANLLTKENELETAIGEIALAKEDRDRWQTRMQNILSKYDRVDPAELENLRQQISQLTEEKIALQDQIGRVDADIAAAKAEAEQAKAEHAEALGKWNDTRSKIVEQAKQRSKDQTANIKSIQEQLNAARAENKTLADSRDEAIAKVEGLGVQLEAANANKDTGNTEERSTTEAARVSELESALEAAQQSVQKETEHSSALQARIDELSKTASELQQQISARPVTDGAEDATHDDLQAQLRQETERAEALEIRASELEADVERLQAATIAGDSADSDSIQQIRSELEKAQQEVATLQARHTAPQNGADSELVAAKEAEFQQKLKDADTAYEEKLAAARDAAREDFNTQHNKRMRDQATKLKEEADRELQQIREQHTTEIESLRKEYDAQVQSLRQTTEQDAQVVQQSPAVGDGGMGLRDEEVKKESDGEFAPPEGWEPSKDLVRGWIKTVPHIKELINSNVNKRIGERVDEAKRELAEEHTRDLASKLEDATKDLQQKLDNADKVKEKAVLLENKKQAAKLGMAENKLRIATVKLEYVERAAKDTPDRIVSDVWTIAQTLKPLAPGSTSTPQASKAAAVAAVAAVSEPEPAPARAPAVGAATSNITEQAAKASANNNTTAAANASAPASNASRANAAAESEATQSSKAPANSSLPRGGMSIRGTAGGRGGIPVPSSASGQQPSAVSAIPRGGHTNRGGRGTNNQRGASQRGGMNAGAPAFTPGQKRARDDSQGPHEGGKRQRGGASGA